MVRILISVVIIGIDAALQEEPCFDCGFAILQCHAAASWQLRVERACPMAHDASTRAGYKLCPS